MKNSEFNEVIGFLKKFDFPVYCYENLCVGTGARIPNPSIHDFALYQWQSTRDRLPLTQKINIIGFSMGGMIAATMCLLEPEKINKLILVSTSINSAEIPAVPDPLFQFLCSIDTPDKLLESLKIGFSPDCLENRPEILARYFDYRLANGNQQTPEDFIAQLQAVRGFPGDAVYQRLLGLKMQKVHIYGAADLLFGKEHILQLKPFVQRQIPLPGLGHMLHLENPLILAEKLASELHTDL